MSLDDYVKTKDGYKLNFRFLDNNKPAMVMVHGLSMDQDSWHHQFQHFKHHYSILSYDIRGHGKSDKPNSEESYTLDRFVEDIDVVADNVGLDKFTLMGFSLGGTTSLRYAQLNPDRLDKLVAINAPYSIDSIDKSFFTKFDIAKKVPKKIIGFGLDDKPIWEYKNKLNTHRKSFMQSDIKVVQNIIKAMKGKHPEATELKIPHLLIYSSDDEIVKASKGPNHTIIEGGHHYVIAQKPDEVNYIIRKFLKK